MDLLRSLHNRHAAALLVTCWITCAVTVAGAHDRQIDRDLSNTSIGQLAEFYETGKYSALDVTQWHLARIAKYEAHYNAFITVFAKEAEERAAHLDAEFKARDTKRGPLWGVPLVVKGSIAIENKTTTVGWWGYNLPGFELRTKANATVVRKVLDAGAIIIGHTNLPDLAKSDTTISSVAGRTANAYNPNFSPGGSSGGSATSIAAGFAVVALGTDGGNSIRNPAANSSLVGVLPTQGLISIAGVHAGDWLRERTGPLTRSVTDAAVMLDVLAGKDPNDSHTMAAADRKRESFTDYLRPGSLRGRRFGVPKFILDGMPTQRPNPKYWNYGTSPATRAQFMETVRELRAAGATVVFADDILPEEFELLTKNIHAHRYHREGVDRFLVDYGPGSYTSTKEFEAIVGVNYPEDAMGGPDSHHILANDPNADQEYFDPKAEAIRVYRETMRRYDLDGFVYPPLQIPPPNECWPLPEDFPSDGPYSATSWANRLGVPAIVVPAGYYGDGLPYGLEISGDHWSDGDLLSYAYDFEQRTRHRKEPALREQHDEACTGAISQE